MNNKLETATKICVFVYDWAVRNYEHSEIFPHNKDGVVYRYFKMSRLTNDEKSSLPSKYKKDGWFVMKKSIFK